MSHSSSVATIAKQVLETEAAALLKTAQNINGDFTDAIELIKTTAGHLIVSGIGKSGHIGNKIAATLASTGTPSFFIHPTEAFHGDLGSFTEDDTALLISNSGETEEVVRLLPVLQDRGIRIISMTGNPNSSLAKGSHVHLSIAIDREACPNNLAPTTSTTLTLALGDALAIALIHERQFSPEDFAKHHPGGSLGKALALVGKSMTTSYIPTIPPCATPQLIVNKLNYGRLGIVLVMDNETLIGVITDGDLRRAMENLHLFATKTAAQIMTDTPITLNPHMRVQDAMRIFNQHHIKAAPVLDHNKEVIGIFHA